MSEWTLQKIDNLPSDFLTGNYEFKEMTNPVSIKGRISMLLMMESGYGIYIKTTEAPTPPSHEEIMRKWWKIMGGVYVKIISHDSNAQRYYYVSIDGKVLYRNKEEFIELSSYDTPPEG